MDNWILNRPHKRIKKKNKTYEKILNDTSKYRYTLGEQKNQIERLEQMNEDYTAIKKYNNRFSYIFLFIIIVLLIIILFIR